ncbi:MAG: ABC transporter [Brevundimonas sp.]|nr:ABC-F family ATP-binding cassette domain-containing protein [Brevundimonas sp.]PZU74237.1 MAG: ABC transporter [Brevundimonas sp.]
MPINPSPSASVSAFVTLTGVAARTPDGSTLFDNLTLAFGAERTGVVGRNGVGKSTLLRLISGASPPSEGTVARVGRIGVLEQRYDPAPEETVAGALGVERALEVVDRVVSGQGAIEDMDVVDWTLEARVADVLEAVKLAGVDLKRPMIGLSGGEQTRVRLGRLLLDGSDMILLDEPTNHLDREARTLVAEILGRWRGGAVVVSHDRELLRHMDRIVEISSLGVEVYGGNYDLYAKRKAVQREAAERGLIEAEKDVARAGADAQRRLQSKARRDAAGRRKAAKGDMPKILLGARAERAENTGAANSLLAGRKTQAAAAALSVARERVERTRSLSFQTPSSRLVSGRTVLALDAVSWRTSQGRTLVGPLTLRIVGPERLAVTGANGTGKTTLLRLIAGELEPTSGRIERPVPAAYLDQETTLLRANETVLEAWLRLNPAGAEHDAQAALAHFLFRNSAAHRRVGALSGGERLRAALACVMTGATPPMLMVLDEPTNHLDLDAVAALETALRDYDGALVLVSHDPDFLRAVGVTRTIAL